jgi:hypothetical protein
MYDLYPPDPINFTTDAMDYHYHFKIPKAMDTHAMVTQYTMT